MSKKFSSNYLADDFLKIIGKRKLWPPLNNYSAFIQGSEWNTQKYFHQWYNGKVRCDMLILMKEGFSQIWLTEDDLIHASEKTIHEFLHTKEIFQKRIEYLEQKIIQVNRIYALNTYEKIKMSSWSKLFSLIQEIRDAIWSANGGALFSIYFDKDFLWKIIQSKHLAIERDSFDALWEEAIEPAFESFDVAQRIHFLRLLAQKKSWKEIVEQCQYFLTDYHSAKSLSDIDLMLKERYLKNINSSVNADTTISSEKKDLEEKTLAHQQWLQQLPSNQRNLADYIQIVMKIRDRRKNFFAKGLTVIWRIAERMFAEANISSKLIPYYTVRELLEGKEYLKTHQKELNQRPKGFELLIDYEGKIKMQTYPIDLSVSKINECFMKSNSAGKKNIIGQTGCSGKAQGVVRIVLDAYTNHRFKEGEILVTGMTRPEYVPLMKKAAAIVTDEGGITCHAAIISRELNKPCIIGTKIATRMLKTGDLVEVDATKGIVRLIKKHKI